MYALSKRTLTPAETRRKGYRGNSWSGRLPILASGADCPRPGGSFSCLCQRDDIGPT